MYKTFFVPVFSMYVGRVVELYGNFFLFIYFWCAGSSLLCGLFSGCGERNFFSCSAEASHCDGFFCFGALALGSSGFSGGGMWVQ